MTAPGPAYVDASVHLHATGQGPLDGLSFAVKDVFDIAGRVTGAGCPAYATGRAPAARTAPVIVRLRGAGATLRGVTVTEEMMFGVLGQPSGETAPPANPHAPDRLPGGSSSGSASASAAGDCDFALGTDTGGSIRVPASFCGLYGMRPGPGAVDVEGVVPLAPRFDRVGWLARSAQVFAAVGEVLLPAEPARADAWPGTLWVLPELVEDLPPDLSAEVETAVAALASGLGCKVSRASVGSAPEAWGRAYKALQGRETWATHGPWIEAAGPALGPVARGRFAAAARASRDDARRAAARATALAAAVLPRLTAGAVLVAPTTPGPAPRRDAALAELEAARAAVLDRTALSGLLDLAEISLPLLSAHGAPVGLSLMAPATHARRLVALGAGAARPDRMITHATG